MKPLSAELLGTSRSAILAALMLRPETELHARELARVTGVSIGTLQRELGTLLAHGLVNRREVGRQVFYSANRTSLVFEELASLLRKTAGLADVLREALSPLAQRIRCAFVYGSMAAGGEGARSDIDVMVIGDVSFAEVAKALHGAQATLGREVNPTVMRAAEFVAKRRARDGFVASVTRGAKVWLVGGDDDFAKLGKDRPTASA